MSRPNMFEPNFWAPTKKEEEEPCSHCGENHELPPPGKIKTESEISEVLKRLLAPIIEQVLEAGCPVDAEALKTRPASQLIADIVITGSNHILKKEQSLFTDESFVLAIQFATMCATGSYLLAAKKFGE